MTLAKIMPIITLAKIMPTMTLAKILPTMAMIMTEILMTICSCMFLADLPQARGIGGEGDEKSSCLQLPPSSKVWYPSSWYQPCNITFFTCPYLGSLQIWTTFQKKTAFVFFLFFLSFCLFVSLPFFVLFCDGRREGRRDKTNSRYASAKVVSGP